MYYEINVAVDGKHYFATAERSFTNGEAAMDAASTIHNALKVALPTKRIETTVTQREHTGKLFAVWT